MNDAARGTAATDRVPLATGGRPLALLGPQRLRPTLDAAVAQLGVRGPLGLITAGWQEREEEDSELVTHLGGRTVNLRLYARMERAFAADAELSAFHRQRQQRLQEMRALYNLRLSRLMDTLMALWSRTGDSELLQEEREEVVAQLQALDQGYLQRVAAVHASFDTAVRPWERAAVVKQRTEIQRQLEECAGLAIAGGHIAVLLNRMRLLGVRELFEQTEPPHADSAPARPVFAWSAGAMAVCEQVVLFHDSPPQGPGNAEAFDHGLAFCRGIVPLPHARRRLRLDDPGRVARFARRLAPRRALAMDDGSCVLWRNGRWSAGPGVAQLRADGAVTELQPGELA